MFERFVIRLALILFVLMVMLASKPVQANDAFIYYKNSGTYTTTSQYNNLKTELEDAGFTVSSSTSGTVSSSDVSGQDLVIDITGSSNCGSTCRSVYDSYVSGGGKLLIAGTYGATNRNSSTEALIENKMQVGTIGNFSSSPSDSALGSVEQDDYSSDFNSNYLPGVAYVFNVSDGSGTQVAANSTVSDYWSSWHKWDYGTNGGAVMITFGYTQFLSTTYYATNMETFLGIVMEEEGLYTSTPTYTSSISNAQTQQITTSRAVTHNGNGIYINQVGNDNELDIVQDGSDNLVAGVGSTSSNIVNADIIGNNNDTTLTQRGDNNVILFDVTGDTNTTTVSQGGSSGADDNRLEFDVNGDSNILSITQNHNDGIGNNGHFLAIDLDGDTNNILSSQLNDGDKKAFLSVQGDDNDIDLYQQGSGSHYAEIAVGSDQTVGITQDGTGNHNASVSMTGHSATLDLTQDSSNNQVYSINQNCANANGCGTTTVTQN